MDEKRLVDGATALAEKQSCVIKIEPAERPQNVRLRVAAYTRVSSDSEDQLNSFAAQNRYYTELISSKAEWRMVDIYSLFVKLFRLKIQMAAITLCTLQRRKYRAADTHG